MAFATQELTGNEVKNTTYNNNIFSNYIILFSVSFTTPNVFSLYVLYTLLCDFCKGRILNFIVFFNLIRGMSF